MQPVPAHTSDTAPALAPFVDDLAESGQLSTNCVIGPPPIGGELPANVKSWLTGQIAKLADVALAKRTQGNGSDALNWKRDRRVSAPLDSGSLSASARKPRFGRRLAGLRVILVSDAMIEMRVQRMRARSRVAFRDGMRRRPDRGHGAARLP